MFILQIVKSKRMKETDIRQNSFRAWLLAARPKTLTGAAVPVMIGMALAYTDSQSYPEEHSVGQPPHCAFFLHS